MAGYDDLLIRVQAHWNDWSDAAIRLDDLQDVHWHRPPGAPHPLLHGYVCCSRILTGDIPHWCEAKSAPHRLHVCVLKGHTLSPVYSELIRRADVQHRWSPVAAR
jgi:hypothetical protein